MQVWGGGCNSYHHQWNGPVWPFDLVILQAAV